MSSSSTPSILQAQSVEVISHIQFELQTHDLHSLFGLIIFTASLESLLGLMVFTAVMTSEGSETHD